jgi:C4-dicarboxylate-binding protein DctP
MSGRSLSLLLLAFLMAAPQAGAQEVKLRVALQSTMASLQGTALVRLKEEVERRSNGALTLEVFDQGKLFLDAQMVDAVSSGAVEIGATASQKFVDRAPSLAILDLPFFFNFKALAEAATEPGSELRTLIDETVLDEVGARVLLWLPIGDTHFYSKGRDVADPDRLKDLRVAVPGDALHDLVVRCGGRPTTAATRQFSDHIGRGELDAALMTLTGVEVLGLWKVQDTITLTAHAPVEFLVVIHEGTWQALSPRHRTIVTEAARIVEREGRERVARIEATSARFARDKGMKLVSLTPDQVAEWRACTADMVADYMEKNGHKARRLMEAYAKLRVDPCCSAMPGEVAFTRW